jgi:hypothetical protein
MTPIQYLTARVHTYYFRAFVILCILIAAIVVLAITYQPASSSPISRGAISGAFQDAIQADRQRIAANAANSRIQDAQTKIEAMRLSRIPEYYVQEFGAPAKKSKTKGVLELDWINDLYELDIAFVNDSSVTFCVISQSANFKPKVPAENEEPPREETRLGDAALAGLADAYVWNNWGASDGSTVVHYGLSGSHADDFLYGFVAVVASRAQYPEIKGSDQLPTLTPADSHACCSDSSPRGTEPINAFAVTDDSPTQHPPGQERPPVPDCLEPPR